MSKLNKLWWYPPQPLLRVHQHLTVNMYFTRCLLLWMPRKLSQTRLHCPRNDFDMHLLAGLYPHVTQVLDLDGYYSLVTEHLECGNCKRKVISWSQGILHQLDVGHRKQFPIIITYNYACDMRVVRLLRQRGFGNSSTQLQKKLTEQHNEQWLQCTAHYLTDVKHLWRLANDNWSWPQSLMSHHLFLPFQKQAGFLQFTAGMCCHGLRK